MTRKSTPELEFKPAPTQRRAPDAAASLAGRNIFMVGIGGCGMSGLARMLRRQGASVTGSDLYRGETSARLEKEGISVTQESAELELPDSCDAIVHSAAIKPDHPMMLAAQHRGLPVHTYAEMLGLLMQSSTGVAVAGTHGKSTTTAMLGSLLTDAGLDPSVIVGATCPTLADGSLGSAVFSESVGYRVGARACPAGPFAGRPGLLVAEACEFNRSFHNFHPVIGSISAVEADHLDVYGSLEAVVQAFRVFAEQIAPADQGGLLLIGHEGAERRSVASGLACRVETIGFNPAADWVVAYDPKAHEAWLNRGGETIARWGMRIPGHHNAMNAGTALVLGMHLGADPAVGARSLAHFRGVDRRTQFLGERPMPGGAVRIFDDYGHHPTEVDATLRALRDFDRPQDRGGRLICVFQPHQHSRTRFLLEEFAAAFSQADVVIVPHIYFVRDSELERTKVTAEDLVDRLRTRGVKAMHLYPFDAIVEQLENLCRPGDLLVVMGAGPVNEVARRFIETGKVTA